MRIVRGGDSLATGLAFARIDVQELWLLYFALGGAHACSTLESYVFGDLSWPALQHDMAAHALNEYLDDNGMDHLVRYARELA